MATSDEAHLLQVASKLKSAEAAPLKAMLAERRGRPVALDFGSVTQIGTQCMQVLAAASAAWAADGVAFEVRNMSDDIREGVQLCGLSPSQLGAKEAQNDA